MKNPAIQTLDASSSITEISGIIDQDGVVKISGVLSAEALATLHEELAPHFEKSKFCEGPFFGARTKRLHSLVAKSAICREMITHPLVLKIMDHILGGNCDKFQLNLTQGVQIWPGEQQQLLHRDDVMFPMNMSPLPYELMADVMWAYTDFTKENGATIVVPGSHKWEDRKRKAVPDEMVQAEMRAGDFLVYVGSLIHSGASNISGKPRTGLIISYCLGWLRQFENQYLVAPPALSKNYSKELQDLLGYTIHRPNLGMYEGCEPRIAFDMPDLTEIVTCDWLTERQYEYIEQQKSPFGSKSTATYLARGDA